MTTFVRDQGFYLSLAPLVGAIFWAFGQPINPFTVILYWLCLGNLAQSLPRTWWARHLIPHDPFSMP
jgi:hypothetical protein